MASKPTLHNYFCIVPRNTCIGTCRLNKKLSTK